ncbi:MAG TPA: diacylglycerol kinase family protein, partial [Allosphingosinicella sp.]|nr:diacylglycerol kinase family protein [Allosphingosinicella sp.]
MSSRPVPKQAVLVVNAHSRRGRALFREAVEKLRGAGIELIAAHALRNPRLLPDTVREAVRGGAPMVIVGGGDGSLSCAVDELVDRDCVFALLPLGTANSFARTLGIPLDLDGAIAAVASGRRRRIDLGM